MDTLVKTYHDTLYRYLRHMLHNSEDAKDVLQNTWIQIYTHLGELRQQASERAYIYRVATNCAYMWLRDEKALPSLEDIDPEAISQIPADTTISLGEELVCRLEQTILRLPPAQRAVFCLRYHEELSYEEIAQITDSTIGAAKTNYSLAKAKISRWITAAAASLLLLLSVGLGMRYMPTLTPNDSDYDPYAYDSHGLVYDSPDWSDFADDDLLLEVW